MRYKFIWSGAWGLDEVVLVLSVKITLISSNKTKETWAWDKKRVFSKEKIDATNL